MLGGKEAIGTVAVKDLTVARKFYEGTLGLKLEDAHRTAMRKVAISDVVVLAYDFASSVAATAVGAEDAVTDANPFADGPCKATPKAQCDF